MERLNLKNSEMKPNIFIDIGILWFILYTWQSVIQVGSKAVNWHTHTQKKLPTIQNVYRFHHSWQTALNHFKWARQFCNVTSPLRQFRSSKQIQIQIFCKILLQILITKRYLLYIFMYLYVSSTVLVSMETLKSIWLILSKNFNNLIKKSNLAWSGGSVG